MKNKKSLVLTLIAGSVLSANQVFALITCPAGNTFCQNCVNSYGENCKSKANMNGKEYTYYTLENNTDGTKKMTIRGSSVTSTNSEGNLTYEVPGGTFTNTFPTDVSSIDFSGNVSQIGPSAFWGATGLTSVNFSGVQTIGTAAFSHTGLTSVDLTGVQEIGSSAFSDATNLKNVTLSGIEMLPAFAFSGTSVENLDLTGVKKIEQSAFDNVTLTTLNLTGVEEIEGMAFYGLTLKSLVLPDSLFSEDDAIGISQFAFVGSNVGTIYCPKGQNCAVYFKTCDSNAYNSYYEDGICYSDDIDDEVDPIPLSAKIVNYSIENGKIKLENGKTYASFEDLQKGNYIKHRIYTIEEANAVAGEKNRVSITYR